VAKAVIRKPLKKESAEEVEEETSENPEWVAHCFEFRHQFLVGVKMVEGGELIDDVGTWEEVQQEIRELLKKRFPHGHFTPSGGYLLVHEDGGRVRACYPHDFDYEKMERKPGTVPPLYTLSHEEQLEVKELQKQIEQRAQREKAREIETGSNIATNPRTLLTARETDRLSRIVKKVPAKKVEAVEWTEEDAADETLAEKETAKLLGNGNGRKRRLVKRK
jgi:ASC-1-like (ASCH) protein